MTMNIVLHHRNFELSPEAETRIRHQLETLGRRVSSFPDPLADLRLEQHDTQRRVTAELTLQLGPNAQHIVSHQAAETADRAAMLAVVDGERQLERQLASMRNEHTYGVPSRREPEALRPHPPGRKG